MKRILILLTLLAVSAPGFASGKALFHKRLVSKPSVDHGTREVRFALVPVNSRWLQLTRITVTRDSCGRVISVKRR